MISKDAERASLIALTAQKIQCKPGVNAEIFCSLK